MLRNGLRLVRAQRSVVPTVRRGLTTTTLTVSKRSMVATSSHVPLPAIYRHNSTATPAPSHPRQSGKVFLGVDECDKLLTAPGSPFETAEVLRDGRRVRSWKHTPRDFALFIRDNMPQWGDRVFLSTPIAAPEPFEAREHVTFAQAYERTVEVAALLREHGVGVGDRVAVGGNNSTGWVVSCLATQLIGAVPVLLNNGLVGESQEHCLKLTKPKIVLADDKLAAQLAGTKLDGVGPVWCWGPTGHLSPEAQAGVTELSTLTPKEETMASVKAGDGLESLGPDSDAIVFFTSGTTSMPKGVLVTQHQALHIIHSTTYQAARTALRQGVPADQAAREAFTPKPEVVSMLSIPLFHVQGTLTWLMLALHNGSKLVFLRHWSVPTAVELMVEEKVGKIGGVPAIPAAILQSPLIPDNFPLQSTTYGGVTAPTDLAHRLVKRFPTVVPGTGWGMTETSAFHTGFNGQEYLDKPHGAGQALPVTEIRVVDPKTRRELPRGEVGLLEARGQNIMKCYVDNPKATAETIHEDGWLDTGDLAFIDDFGDLHMSDRVKDIIIRGGENIPSAEVERAVLADPRIHEAAAVSVPCDVMGERVGVAVSLAPGVEADESTPLSIAKEAWPRLRYCARPDIVMVLDKMPWNPSQKVLKGEVKKIVQAEWERVGRKPLVNSRDAASRI